MHGDYVNRQAVFTSIWKSNLINAIESVCNQFPQTSLHNEIVSGRRRKLVLDYMSRAGPVSQDDVGLPGSISARLLNAIKINFAITWQPGQPG